MTIDKRVRVVGEAGVHHPDECDDDDQGEYTDDNVHCYGGHQAVRDVAEIQREKARNVAVKDLCVLQGLGPD